MPLMQMQHDVPPDDDIRDRVGDLDEVSVTKNNVLVGIYVRSNKTVGGIHLPDSVVSEDLWQGIAGLVLKFGPKAFDESYIEKFGSSVPTIGDWIMFKSSNGIKLDIRKVRCILLPDTHIEMVVPTPDMIF